MYIHALKRTEHYYYDKTLISLLERANKTQKKQLTNHYSAPQILSTKNLQKEMPMTINICIHVSTTNEKKKVKKS